MTVSQTLRQAQAAARRGDTAEAARLYQLVLTKFPGNRDAQAGLKTLGTPQTHKGDAPPREDMDALVALYRSGDMAAVCAKAEELAGFYPKSASVLNLLGLGQTSIGQHDDAVQSFTRALKLAPGQSEVLGNLAAVQLKAGRVAQAADSFRRAIEAGGGLSLFTGLATALRAAGRIDEAAQVLRDAVARAPGNYAMQVNLANALQAAGDVGDAEATYRKAIALKPADPAAYSNLAELYEKKNDPDAMEALLAQATDAGAPRTPQLVYRMAQIAQHRKDFDGVVTTLSQVGADDLPASLRAPFHELRGKALDRDGRYAEAFAAFEAMNAAARAQGGWPAPSRPGIEALARAWTTAAGDLALPKPATPSDRPAPAFLIGFPRSGTTLLDTVLRSHPAISVIEEKPMVQKLLVEIGSAATPDAVMPLTPDRLDALRTRYFDEADRHLSGDRPQVLIDKLPLNICNIGLIRAVFPDARFILALRHPCDSVLSCLMQNFRPNAAMANFLTLDDAARTYAAVMGLWHVQKERLTPETVTLKYEDLINDIEGSCRPVIAHLGLDWDDSVLDYQKTARGRDRVNTPSYAQVTQPLYSHARGRWENYRDAFAPVLDILTPQAERLGYAIPS